MTSRVRTSGYRVVRASSRILEARSRYSATLDCSWFIGAKPTRRPACLDGSGGELTFMSPVKQQSSRLVPARRERVGTRLRRPRLGKLVIFESQAEQLSTRARLQLSARQFLEVSRLFTVVSGPASPGPDRPLAVADCRSPRHDAFPNPITSQPEKVLPLNVRCIARINLLWINLWTSQPLSPDRVKIA